MIMKMRGDKCHPGRGKRVKIPLLPNNVGKKSANDAGPKQGHDNKYYRSSLCKRLERNLVPKILMFDSSTDLRGSIF